MKCGLVRSDDAVLLSDRAAQEKQAGVAGGHQPATPPVRSHSSHWAKRPVRLLPLCLADTGSAETIFPADSALLIRAALLPATSQSIVWRGTPYPIRRAPIELEISSSREVWRWPATVGFTSAPLPFPLLGVSGFFENFNACFVGDDKALELTTNSAFHGTVRSVP